MAYFRARNKIQTEYSGYEQASDGLRSRLAAIVDARTGYHIGIGNEGYFLNRGQLDHETSVRLNKIGLDAIRRGSYDEVFEATEIFLHLVHANLYQQTYDETLRDVAVAFRTAGSVYGINENGEVVLVIPQETAQNVDAVEKTLGEQSAEALDFFQRALHDLLTRGRSANDIVKDFAIAMEDYVKALAGQKDYTAALRVLRDRGVVAAAQQGVLEKLYAYRGDASGVAHTGNTEEPGEADALWFLETLVAQVKMIGAKTRATERT